MTQDELHQVFQAGVNFYTSQRNKPSIAETYRWIIARFFTSFIKNEAGKDVGIKMDEPIPTRRQFSYFLKKELRARNEFRIRNPWRQP